MAYSEHSTCIEIIVKQHKSDHQFPCVICLFFVITLWNHVFYLEIAEISVSAFEGIFYVIFKIFYVIT